LLDWCFTTWAMHLALFYFGYFLDRGLCFCLCLRLWSSYIRTQLPGYLGSQACHHVWLIDWDKGLTNLLTSSPSTSWSWDYRCDSLCLAKWKFQ
jgi:hypothetical protein